MSFLWEERAAVTGPSLHALIVGVSDYEFLPASEAERPRKDKVTLNLTKLKTPAAGAFRVAKWLKEKYWHPTVQLKTIRLLLSPSAEEQADELGGLDCSGRRATSANVQKALDDWKDACRHNRDGIAFLYVAGHGMRWNYLKESIVLLEDFGTPADFLSETIDVEKTRRAMKGVDLPPLQFLFADACKVNPDEVEQWREGDDPGTPKAPKPEPKNNAVISAPLYHAAYPGQLAGGYRGQGTYLAQALVECLDGYGWTPPSVHPRDPVEGYFRITPGGLAEKLQERVTAIAGNHEDDQTPTVGEYPPGLGILCASKETPLAPFELTVKPDQAAMVAEASLVDYQGNLVFQPPQVCHPPWRKEVRVGTHSLELDLKTGTDFKKPRSRPVVVMPFEGWSGVIELK